MNTRPYITAVHFSIFLAVFPTSLFSHHFILDLYSKKKTMRRNPPSKQCCQKSWYSRLRFLESIKRHQNQRSLFSCEAHDLHR